MQDGLKPTAPQLALDTWAGLPRKQRNFARLNSTLAELGYEAVNKSTFYRWLKVPPEKRAAQRAAQKAIARAAVVPVPIEPQEAVDLNGVPEELIEAFGLRVLLVAKGSKAHDLAEAAIVSMIEAIAAKADDIAEQLLMPETEVVDDNGSKTITRSAGAAKGAVETMAQLVDALHRVTASRTLPSLAHRNFSEGDRLIGEAKKFLAEADTIANAGRSDNAKTIDQPGTGSGDNAEYEAEALAAIQEIERGK